MPSGSNFFNYFPHLHTQRCQITCTGDALSGRYTLLFILDAKIVGFYTIEEFYKEDKNF